ncbi:hypothetical protein [Bacteriovorax sp. DB6_IX]|uniref:hypothetical protein n=1 Tax=Bacteriovorax sp. DB6_IX TaxID=1353530 RepID=UPI00038A47A9|nr:hypothetical protein [Bacteriovorax sp. DB6_IX]EQC50435.1 hypothetical protein M901_1497 [Bacteriovorax sp. DB6_IX]
MKAIKVVLMLVFLQSIASASVSLDCYDSFFENYQILDSKSFVVHDDILDADFEENPVSYVKEAILNVVEKAPGCQKGSNGNKAVPMDLEVSCKELVPGKSYSRSCFAESSLGYFFVNQDMLGNVNVIFNRWD